MGLIFKSQRNWWNQFWRPCTEKDQLALESGKNIAANLSKILVEQYEHRRLSEGWGCVQCTMNQVTRPCKQASMMKWNPLRRFQIIEVDVLEVTTTFGGSNSKGAVIGDSFNRFVWAVSIKYEGEKTMARVLLDEWLQLFGPPERILSDRGPCYVSDIIKHICKSLGMRKDFTSPYHPQTDGFIERFNKNIMWDIREYVSTEEVDWSEHLSIACFRYNPTMNTATKCAPCQGGFRNRGARF